MEEQKTISKDFILKGQGLQTGKPVTMHFYPANANEGIVFIRTDSDKKSSVRLADITDYDTDRRSKISVGSGCFIETVEHVLAALWGACIDNVRIELDGSEPPAMDGSALGFLKALQGAGVTGQAVPRKFIEIKRPLWAEENESFLGIFPSNVFKISYILEYPDPAIGRQFFSKVIDGEIFEREIAPARTFCLKQESEALLKAGYGKGATVENTLVMDERGPVDNVLRFPDEPVRHKVLDLIGDLFLLGRPVRGRIIAIRSGHKLNLEIVKKIQGVHS